MHSAGRDKQSSAWVGGRTRRRLALATTAIAAFALSAFAAAPFASAESMGPINFEPTAYATGNINNQNGWMKTGPYDVGVAAVSSFSDALGYGFGAQALRISNAVADGAFGGQAFSPALQTSAGELLPVTHYDASFKIGTTQATQQPGLAISVSPDDGTGDRMSYLRFEDQADGVHVFFVDVTDPGPLPTGADFNETEIATLSRSAAHTIEFSIDFVPGPGNDVVKILIDGSLAHTGTTWEDYYRFDSEQSGNNNRVPLTNRLAFLSRGSNNPSVANNGYLIDGVSLASQAAPGPAGPAGPTGATGPAGPAGSSNSIALKRKMAISFTKSSVSADSTGTVAIPVRCTGSVASHCVGTLTLRALGTAQSATFAIPRGKSAQVRVHLRARLRQMLSTGGAGVKARAIARTEQPAGSLFKSSHRLRLS